MTIGVLSIPRGDKLASDITMICTIKPDGPLTPSVESRARSRA